MRFAWVAVGSSVLLASCLFPPVIELSKCHDSACENAGGGEAGGGSPPVVGGNSPGGGGAGGDACEGVLNYRQVVMDDMPASYFRLSDSVTLPAANEMQAPDGEYAGAVKFDDGALACDRDNKAMLIKLATNTEGTGAFFPHGFGFDLSGNVTLEVWIKPMNLRSNDNHSVGILGRCFATEDGQGGAPPFQGLFMMTNADTDRPQFCRQGDGPGCAKSLSDMAVDQWSHVVGTFFNGTVRIWVNGVEGDAANNTGVLPIEGPDGVLVFRLGSAHDWNDMSGSLDEFAVYPHALDGQQICRHHAVGRGLDVDIACPP
jgi:hypothetical protein